MVAKTVMLAQHKMYGHCMQLVQTTWTSLQIYINQNILFQSFNFSWSCNCHLKMKNWHFFQTCPDSWYRYTVTSYPNLVAAWSSNHLTINLHCLFNLSHIFCILSDFYFPLLWFKKKLRCLLYSWSFLSHIWPKAYPASSATASTPPPASPPQKAWSISTPAHQTGTTPCVERLTKLWGGREE